MGNKAFFISDIHLGLDTPHSSSYERESKVVEWLDMISDKAEYLFLVGDIFDYWFEYRCTIPKGFSRFWSRIVMMREKGVIIHFFMGNHDMWISDYFSKEYGFIVHSGMLEIDLYGHKYIIGHGDGLGRGDYGYKFIKAILRNPILQYVYGMLPASWGLPLMIWFSKKERKNPALQEPITDISKERLVHFVVEQVRNRNDVKFYVFGHRHLAISYNIPNTVARYINLGEWMYACSYGVADSDGLHLKFYKSEFNQIHGSIDK
jgi:UDP-2,3-diacylglucosamine hydrolase